MEHVDMRQDTRVSQFLIAARVSTAKFIDTYL